MNLPSLIRGRQDTPRADARATLTPQMEQYSDAFSDSGTIQWLPYVMYFHPPNHHSEVVNTDALGFRLTDCGGRSLSVGGCDEPVANILAGGSTAFGIGATHDRATMASRLNAHHPEGSVPWLNAGGRSHNSAQELILHALTRHKLQRIERIVLFSGFNDLGLVRLGQPAGFDSGSFFLCNAFHKSLNGLPPAPVLSEDRLSIDEQISRAAELVLRHLDIWRALTTHSGTTLTYVLQPLASWIRDSFSPEEEALFAQLDHIGGFSEHYGDISRADVGEQYAGRLREGCYRLGIDFVEMAPLIAEAIELDDWLFVDRIHFTDFGYDLVVRLLTEVAMN